jgi:hypothetical protein
VLAPGRDPQRRIESLVASFKGRSVVVQDQRPLQRGHVELTGGWKWEDLLRELDRRVFFWPGDADGPSKHGRRHAGVYASSGVATLRASFVELIDANASQPPFFCRYNSGAPRATHGGRKSPRGPDTFVPAAQTAFTATRVVEVSFKGSVALPSGVEVQTASGGWRPLLTD